MLTRREAILSAMAAAWPAKAQVGTVYVRPPQSLSAVRADGVHVLDPRVQRDRIIGARTRCYTPSGTVFNFTRVVDGSRNAYAKFDAATYARLLTANPSIFHDCTLASSIIGEAVDGSPVALSNPGTHPQLCLMIGDSLMDSTVGGTSSNGLFEAQNQCWAQPVTSKVAPWTATGDYSQFWNKSALTDDPMLPLARICWKFALGGWRLASLPGITYPNISGGWADQRNYLTAIPVLSGQKLDVVIQAGTNDFHESQGQLMWGSPAQGSPNLAINCLAPLVRLLRAQLPIHRIGVMTPIARYEGTGPLTPLYNQAYSDYANWLVVNAASIGVDVVADSRNDPALDCRLWQTNTLDTNVYQIDRTHLTANGYVHHLGPLATSLLDGMAG